MASADDRARAGGRRALATAARLRPDSQLRPPSGPAAALASAGAREAPELSAGPGAMAGSPDRGPARRGVDPLHGLLRERVRRTPPAWPPGRPLARDLQRR